MKHFLAFLLLAVPITRPSQIKYKQNATGSVERSLATKLGDVVSVKDFGALGDGATDDTVAIQAAINSTGTGAGRQITVFFPDGTYILSNTLSVPEGVELLGGGMWKAKLDWGFAFAGVGIQWVNGAPNDYPIIIRNLAMHALGACIDTALTSGATIDNLWLTCGIGVQISGQADIAIHDIVFDQGSQGITFAAGSATNNINIYNNTFSAVNFPITIQGGRDIHIENNDFRQYGGGIGIYSPSAANTMTNVIISSNSFYNSTHGTSTWMKLTGTLTGFTIVNNLVDGTGAEGLLCDAGTVSDFLISDNQFRSLDGNVLSFGTGSCSADKIMISHNVFFSGIQKAALLWRGAGQVTFNGNTIFHANGSGQTLLNGAAVDVDGATLFYANTNVINTALPTYGFLIRSGVTKWDYSMNYVAGPGTPFGAFNANYATDPIGGPLQLAQPGGSPQTGAIFQGSGVPSNTYGNNGDIYFRMDTPSTVNQRFYIKSAGAWIAHGTTTTNTLTVLTYSATIASDASLGNSFSITATNGTAFTISNPTNLTTGQRVTYAIRNTSGGALGAVTWGTGTFKMGTWASPATGFSRSIDFVYDGTNLVEVSRSTLDVPN